MEIRHKQETKRAVSDRHLLLIPRRYPDKIFIHDLFQEAQRAAGSDDLHLRAQIQQHFHASGMIRLCVADHKVIDLMHINYFF